MGVIARLAADLILNTTRFEAGADRASSKTRLMRAKIQRDLESMGRDFQHATTRILGIEGALAGIISGGGLVYLASKALTAADRVAKLADRLNLTTDEVQQFQYVMKLAGVETEQMETAVTFLNRQMAEGNLPIKNTGDAILDLAERVKNASGGIERARIVSEAFGSKLGAKLIPALMQGKEGMQQVMEQANALGLVMEEKTVRGAEAFKDELENLGNVIATNFGTGLLSGFIDDTQTLKDLYTDPQFIQSVKDVGEAFGALAHGMLEVTRRTHQAIAGWQLLSIEVRRNLSSWNPMALSDEEAESRSLKFSKLFDENLPPVETASGKKGGGGGGGESYKDAKKAAEDRKKSIESVNDSLTRQIVLQDVQIENYGQEEYQIKRATRAKEIDFDLREKGIKLSESEQQSIRTKLDMLRENEAVLADLTEAQKEAEEADQSRREAIQQLGFTFKSAFEEAVTSGGKLRDVLKGMADDIFKLFIRSQVTEPFAKSILGSGDAGGLLGGLFDSQGSLNRLFQTGSADFIGPMPSFAVGIDSVPHDMVAKIHKNEAVLSASDAEAWRKGKGDTYVINAPGADRGAVTELKGLIMALAGPGAVEERVKNAQRRGVL